MKVIDTTGTNIKIKRTPGKNKMIGIDAEGYYYNKEQQVRVTPCCKSFVTYHDDILCCKECWEEMDELIILTPILATK